jgi:hypothetical protein
MSSDGSTPWLSEIGFITSASGRRAAGIQREGGPGRRASFCWRYQFMLHDHVRCHRRVETDFENFKVNAKGTLEKVEGRGLVITQILLRPTLTIKDAGAFARQSGLRLSSTA